MRLGISYIVFSLMLTSQLYAQSGSSLKDFEKKLSDYYDQELISDVISEIGKDEQAKVWSWDIGDYSFDDHNDLACVVRYPKEKSRICSVYFFVDINGTLTPVHTEARAFVESPLEVGVAIKNSGCFLTSKKEQFNWDITGFQFKHGVFVEKDHFSTSRNSGQTIERFRDHISRRNRMHVFSTRNEETAYYHHFHDIPIYPSGNTIPWGLHNPIMIDSPDDVIRGAFFWRGPNDASLSIQKAEYSQAFLVLELFIKDDTLIQSSCDSCLQDKVLIHLSNVLPAFEKKNIVDTANDITIQTIELLPNFEMPHKSIVKKAGSEIQSMLQMHQESQGYRLKMKLPMSALTMIEPDFFSDSKKSIGCTMELVDIDNPYRKEEQTRIVSSDYEEGNPKSLGLMTFYPSGIYDGQVHPHFSKQFVQTLQQLGF